MTGNLIGHDYGYTRNVGWTPYCSACRFLITPGSEEFCWECGEYFCWACYSKHKKIISPPHKGFPEAPKGRGEKDN